MLYYSLLLHIVAIITMNAAPARARSAPRSTPPHRATRPISEARIWKSGSSTRADSVSRGAEITRDAGEPSSFSTRGFLLRKYDVIWYDMIWYNINIHLYDIIYYNVI